MLRTLLIILCLFFTTASFSHAEDNFSLVDMTGKTHQLKDYRGRWVIINYWATWCPPCLEEVPDLVSAYDEYKNQNLMIIGIAFEYPSAQAVAKFVDDMLISYPIVLGNNKIASQIGEASILPSSYIYNPQGKLVQIKHGIINKAFVENLLKPSKP